MVNLKPGAVAVVTGAGSGIGRSTAHALAARGHAVAVVDIDGAAAHTVADELASLANVEAKAIKMDVADPVQIADGADEIEAELGPIDILVNNAGVGMTAHFLDGSLEDWRWIRSINLDGVVNGCHIIGGRMVARGRGHVINISSGLAYTPRASEPHYVVTKAGVLALSQCLRADWAQTGVGVSVICPGVINTPIFERTRRRGRRNDPAVVSRVGRLFARGHDPELVAEAVCRAIDDNRGVVPVGWEARLGWYLNGVVPQRLTDRLARLDIG